MITNSITYCKCVKFKSLARNTNTIAKATAIDLLAATRLELEIELEIEDGPPQVIASQLESPVSAVIDVTGLY